MRRRPLIRWPDRRRRPHRSRPTPRFRCWCSLPRRGAFSLGYHPVAACCCCCCSRCLDPARFLLWLDCVSKIKIKKYVIYNTTKIFHFVSFPLAMFTSEWAWPKPFCGVWASLLASKWTADDDLLSGSFGRNLTDFKRMIFLHNSFFFLTLYFEKYIPAHRENFSNNQTGTIPLCEWVGDGRLCCELSLYQSCSFSMESRWTVIDSSLLIDSSLVTSDCSRLINQ